MTNPGPSMKPVESPETDEQKEGGDDYGRFGLMRSFVERWITRLPLALALGAGEHVKLPPGNSQLIKILEPFEG